MAFTVYRAAAGSGKTFTLVKEYLRLALGARELDGFKHILAITFTNKAAGEMKNRVLQALAEFSGRTEGKRFDTMAELLQDELHLNREELRERSEQVLTAMLHRYQQVSIGTIDSFVARLARQFARELLLDQQFEIILDQEQLLNQSVSRLLARLGEDPLITELLVGFAQEQTEDDKSWDISKKLLEYAKLLLRDQMREILPLLRELDPLAFQEERARLKAAKAHLLQPIQQQAQTIIDRLTQLDVVASNMAGAETSGVFVQIKRLAEGDLNLKKGITGAIEKNVWHGGKASKETKAILQAEADWLSSHCQVLLDLHQHTLERITLIDAILDKQYAMATLALLQREYEAWMEENQAAPLNSLYFRIADLLADTHTPFIYERLGNRYRHFLIDEFQDTSVLQWQNMLPLVENGLSADYDSLLVGDAKQSIYRWRSGEAAQFVQMPLPYGGGMPSPVLEDAYRAETLKYNYRSYKAVIDFNNSYFEWLSAGTPGALQAFYVELAQLGGKPGGLVQVELLPEVEKGADKNEQRLQRILALVGELAAAKVPFGELAVLVRSNKLGSAIAVALLEAGFPVISSDSLLLSQQPHIRLVMGVLQWLLDESDRVNAQACLQLLQSLSGQSFSPGTRLEAAVEQLYGPMPADVWRMLPLSELVEQVLSYFRLLEESNAFVLRLLDLVAEKSEKYRSLAELMVWWHDKGVEASLSMPEKGDAIRVMTYHKSKGLEFGVVIVADADTNNNSLNQKESWISTELSPIGTALVSTTKLGGAGEPFSRLHAEETEMTHIDYVNMLYVAFTRAVGALYILGSEKASRSSNYSFSKNWGLYLSSIGQEATNLYAVGSLPTFERPQQRQNLVLEHHHWSNWRERIALQNHFEGGKDSGAALSLGRMTHELLSALPHKNALESAVTGLVASGQLSHGDVDLLLPAVRELLQRPSIARWFEPGLDVRNEISILDTDGQQYRPDRLVLQNQKAHVLEFKTGAERPEHAQQLRNYLQLLQQMGFETSGELVYIDLETTN
ncbi:MAG: UvrD-helicase domain-containing protein [Sphingobacteriaceae bacterium]|nr:UvrD-helicase domain-containing protein [Sphingobacteriaceae bacterium]